MSQVYKSLAGGAGGGLSVASYTLTPTQILDLPNTTVQIIPAPGAGKFIQVISAFSYLHYNSVPYETNGSLCVQYDSSAGLGGPITFSNYLFVFSGDWIDSNIAGTWNGSAVSLVNSGVYLSLVNDSSIIDGNSPINVKVYYQTITV